VFASRERRPEIKAEAAAFARAELEAAEYASLIAENRSWIGVVPL
jgi:hypothetical protein